MFDEVSDLWYSEIHSLEEKDVKFSLRLTEVLASEKTPFQEIMMMRNKTYGTFFTLDGFVQISERDEFIYHDMIVHPAMAVNPEIRRVLIIGGGDGGTAREVARYPHIEKIDQCEIDERVVRLCQEFIPQTAAIYDAEPRLNLIIGDGLAFVAEAPDAAYDLIIVDSTDP
jgi:spermidine synthase